MAYGAVGTQLYTRKGREPKRYAIYEPNGLRECARRKRQLESGQLTFIRVEPSEEQGSFDFNGRGTFRGEEPNRFWVADKKAA